jgi:hypothetical protein
MYSTITLGDVPVRLTGRSLAAYHHAMLCFNVNAMSWWRPPDLAAS